MVGYDHRVHHRRRLASGLVAIAALSAACGGGDPAGTKIVVTTTASGARTAGSGTSGSGSPVATGTGASGRSGATGVTTSTAPAVPPTVFTTTPPGVLTGGPTLTEASPVTTAGVGALTFGLTVPKAEQALGTRLLPDTAFAAGAQCIVVKPEQGPDAVWFTVVRNTVERLDVRPPSKLRTRSGAGVGSTEAQLKTLFAEKLVVSTVGTAKRATYTPTDAANASFRIIFELDAAGAVTSYRVGRVGAVESLAPCT